MPPLTARMAIFIVNQRARVSNEAGVFDLELGVRDRFWRGLCLKMITITK